jgi:hypothetical protein
MSRHWSVVAGLITLAAGPLAAGAQSENAVGGWAALLSTPAGAFAPTLDPAVPASPATRIGGRLRASHWQFAADDDNTTNYGGALVLHRGRVRAAVEVGLTTKKDCNDCDVTMGGVDLRVPVLTRTTAGGGRVELALAPALGFGNGNDANALALALEMPVSWAIPVGDALRLTPFVAPGVGGGRISPNGEDGEPYSGTRAMIAGGLALQGTRVPFALTIGARHIFIDLEGTKTPTIYGVGFTLSR